MDHFGLAISFVVPAALHGVEKKGQVKGISFELARRDERVQRIREGSGLGEMREWEWGGRRGKVEGFRYRVEDALRAVPGKAVRDARREEVRRELLNSEELKVRLSCSSPT